MAFRSIPKKKNPFHEAHLVIAVLFLCSLDENGVDFLEAKLYI
jgi:hypothetical protein